MGVIKWLLGPLLLGALGAFTYASDTMLTLKSGEIFTVDGPPVYAGREGWLFLSSELRHLSVGPFWGQAADGAGRATSEKARDPLPAIIDFSAQCRKAGAHLVLVPIPPKAVIYPEMLADNPALVAPPRQDTHLRAFYELLRADGVDVLDITDALLAAKSPDQDWYCKTDTHFSPRAARWIAGHIAAHLKTLPGLQISSPVTWREDAAELSLRGDLIAMKGLATEEKIPLWIVRDQTGATPLPARESPLLVIGDSHTLVFHEGGDMHASGAGLVDHLTRELGFSPDLVGVRGSGSTATRVELARRRDQLAGKKAVVWVFTARDFTESERGWLPVPVVK